MIPMPHHPPAVVARPPAVNAAFLLLLGTAALWTIGLVSSVVISATTAPTSSAATAGRTPEQVAQAEAVGQVMTIGVHTFMAFGIAFLAVATFRMRAGRNWARVLLTVVGSFVFVVT